MKANPARTYRQLSAQGASLVGRVIQAYDQIASSLGEAIRAMEARDIEWRTAELNHALTLISHLQAALKFEVAGGRVAQVLDHFYRMARGQILRASAQGCTGDLRELIRSFVSVREAWEEVEKSGVPASEDTPQASSSVPAARTYAPSDHCSAGWNA